MARRARIIAYDELSFMQVEQKGGLTDKAVRRIIRLPFLNISFAQPAQHVVHFERGGKIAKSSCEPYYGDAHG